LSFVTSATKYTIALNILSAKNTGYQKIEYPLNCPTTIERQATEKNYTATTTQNYKFISTAEQENIVIPVFCLE